MNLPGQCEIKVDGKKYHFYFGIDATAEFLHLHRYYDEELKREKDLPLSRFADPFQENESRALLNMFYCGLLAGDTKNNLPEDLNAGTFGRWLDRADEGSFARLVAAYTTSKPLGK